MRFLGELLEWLKVFFCVFCWGFVFSFGCLGMFSEVLEWLVVAGIWCFRGREIG